MFQQLNNFKLEQHLLHNFILKYWHLLILIMCLMLGESLLLLMNPWLAGQFTLSLMNETTFAGLTYEQILLVWLLVLAIQAVFAFSNRYLAGMTGEKILTAFRQRLFDHIQSLPLSYFHDRKRGEVLSLMTHDAYYLSDFITGALLGFFPQVITFLGALFFISLISPHIALMLAVSLPVFFLLIKIIGRQIRPISRAMVDAYSGVMGVVEENLQLLPVIKSFAREEIESKHFQSRNQRLFGIMESYLRIQSLLSPVIYFFAAAAILGLLWISGAQLGTGYLTVAEIVSMVLFSLLLVRPVSGFADLYGQLQRTGGALERLNALFKETPESVHKAPALIGVNGDIEFSGISFSYPGRECVLRDLDLEIKAGETLAITGENGSGKSTLVYLLQRHADPQRGKILIDEVDIRTVSLQSLRQQVGVVSQEVLLMNASIRENISLGQPGASDAAIEQAARSAHALEFIKALPSGFDTRIGDQGVKLSGGQQQRIALARALLKDPPILVLDEATAMFDPEGESSFIHECRDILQIKTVIIITHRPATLALADRIFRLRNGKLYPIPAVVQPLEQSAHH